VGLGCSIKYLRRRADYKEIVMLAREWMNELRATQEEEEEARG